jgi:hypothetical protein
MNLIEVNLVDSDTLLVSFGGFALYVGMPISEFKRVMTPLNVNKAFLIDKDRCWYYKIMQDVKHELKELIYHVNPKYTIFYGCSAGGYASILYGLLLEVDRVMVFQTQTFLSEKYRKKYKDQRWETEAHEAQNYAKEDYLDLWNHDKQCKTVVELFYCENFYHSKIHADLFYKKTNYLNVILNKYECESYPLARNLKNKGELLSIFQDRMGE